MHHMPKVADMVKNIVVTIWTFIFVFIPPQNPIAYPANKSVFRNVPSGPLCCPTLQKRERGSPSLIQEEEILLFLNHNYQFKIHFIFCQYSMLTNTLSSSPKWWSTWYLTRIVFLVKMYLTNLIQIFTRLLETVTNPLIYYCRNIKLSSQLVQVEDQYLFSFDNKKNTKKKSPNSFPAVLHL